MTMVTAFQYNFGYLESLLSQWAIPFDVCTPPTHMIIMSSGFVSHLVVVQEGVGGLGKITCTVILKP